MRLIVALLIIGTSCAQKRIVANDKIILKNQEANFILGTRPLDVVIEKAYYYPSKRRYYVKGYINDIRKNGNDDIRIRVDLIKSADTTKYTYTGKNGDFKVWLSENEIIRFYGEQDKYLFVEEN